MYILVSHPHSENIPQTLLQYGNHMHSKKKKPALLEGTFQIAQNSFFFYFYVDASAYAHRGVQTPLLFYLSSSLLK